MQWKCIIVAVPRLHACLASNDQCSSPFINFNSWQVNVTKNSGMGLNLVTFHSKPLSLNYKGPAPHIYFSLTFFSSVLARQHPEHRLGA